jgi:hypothetical protein
MTDARKNLLTEISSSVTKHYHDPFLLSVYMSATPVDSELSESWDWVLFISYIQIIAQCLAYTSCQYLFVRKKTRKEDKEEGREGEKEERKERGRREEGRIERRNKGKEEARKEGMGERGKEREGRRKWQVRRQHHS